MPESNPDFGNILEVLTRHRVDFIVVGGVCAVLLGAPIMTFDLDIVHSRSQQNLARLSEALTELEANYREHLPKRIVPDLESLGSTGHHLLMTKFGPLDVLGAIGVRDDFKMLVSKIETIDLGGATSVRILNLETLIEVKQKTARDKDMAMLEILRAMKNT